LAGARGTLAVLGGSALLIACGSSARVGDGGSAADGGAGPGSLEAGGSGGGAGTTGTAEPASGMQVLYSGEDNPSLIALDDRYLYWASLEVLRRAPLGGGAPVTLATAASVRAILPVGEDVFFLQSAANAGSVQRVPRAGGDAVRLADGNNPSALAVLGNSLFWLDPGNSTSTGRLLTMSLSGSEPIELATGLYEPQNLALDGGYVYFDSSGQFCSVDSEGASCSGGGIHRIPQAGGQPERILDANASSNLLLNERGMYWLASSPPRVMFAARGGTEREVANILTEGLGTLRADGAALYWSSGDKVLRMPFDDEQVTRLVTQLDGARDVAVRGDWVYVAESVGGRILRVATDGSANRPSGPISGPCPAPLGTAEELALTPRQDTNLERLALGLDPGNVTASQVTYDRVTADVAAIRALAPELAEIGYGAANFSPGVVLHFTDIGTQALAAGEYSAWQCLNDFYGVSDLQTYGLSGDTWATLTFEGVYRIELLVDLYAQLPEVVSAEANVSVGDGSTICAARDGDRYEYVVDRAGGDCPAGCTEHEAHHFESDAAGQVTALDVWDSEDGQPAPAWFGELCR
jgi:hypothetical protein